MHRAQASSNKRLSKRWAARDHARHRARLASIKSRVDNGPPKQYLHLHLNLKKLQAEEERMSQIERDNRILLSKMSAIMRSKNTLDNANTRYAARRSSRPSSLNRLNRKKELARITRENQRILARIQSIQPTYNHVAWEQDRERQLKLLNNICEYPYSPPKAGSADGSPSRARDPRADEDEKVRMHLLKRPKKAATYHQPHVSRHSDDRPYSPDAGGPPLAYASVSVVSVGGLAPAAVPLISLKLGDARGDADDALVCDSVPVPALLSVSLAYDTGDVVARSSVDLAAFDPAVQHTVWIDLVHPGAPEAGVELAIQVE